MLRWFSSIVQRSMTKPEVVFVLGGPGAGKGTQCANIVREFNYVHLSAGDLLRAERQSGSANGDMIEHYIREGKIVPVEVTVNLLKKAMEDSPTKKFLIDGFPRNQDNVDGWNKIMADVVDVKFVLFLDCPAEECINRILERGKTSGRSDDNLESLTKRFNTFEKESMPVVQHFERQGLVRKIHALRTPEEVFADVAKLFS